MSTLRPASLAARGSSRVDNLVLATGIVRQAEVLLLSAEGRPHVIASIEAALDAALDLTPRSTASEVRYALQHLAAAEAALAGTVARVAV